MMEPAVELKNVSVVRDGNVILDSLNLVIESNESVAIIGPNGSGKTTLIKLLTGEIRIYYDEQSSIRLFGLENWNLFDLRSRIGVVSMDLQNAFDDDVDVSEVILSGCFSSMDVFRDKKITDNMRKMVLTSAIKMGLEDLLDRKYQSLSLGEMRRTLIARAIAWNSSLLILDEPMTGLDIVTKDAFRRMFDILYKNEIKIVMITHELEDIPSSVNRVIGMKNGKIVFDGKKNEMLNDNNVSLLFDRAIRVKEKNGTYSMEIV